MMAAIKLIATDMDGTFLDDEKRVPEENIHALAECAARGIQIVPATGRIMSAIPDEIRTLPGVHYAITTNGASVVDLKNGTTIASCCMDAELAASVMEMARDCADEIMYDAYIEGIGYSTDEFYGNLPYYVQSPALVELVRKTRRPVPDNIAHVRMSGGVVEKVNMFFVDMEARARMRARLEAIPGIVVTSAISNNLEINAVGADKGSALRLLAAHLGIPMEETMAFGDGGNDLTMIQAAGIGVAMANGEAYVKAAADHITVTNNEAGVAAAIRQLILSR